MRKRDLDSILRKHARWLRNEPKGGRADLSRADLSGADLSGADLSGADLSGADLSGAKLYGARGFAPPMLLLASWGAVSDALCADLMRYDAANCPDGEARFSRWAAGGPCPYGWGDDDPERVSRSANFDERQALWSPGPALPALDLMRRLLAEKCPPWTDEQRAAFDTKHKEKSDA